MLDKIAVRILVVDDEPFMLKVNARALEKLGFLSVMCCEGAQPALDELDMLGIPPQVIMLDLNMPGIDGIEFIRQLITRDYAGSLILVSGEDERMLRSAQKIATANNIRTLGYLRKPINASRLAAILKNYSVISNGAPATVAKSYDVESIREGIANNELINYYQPKVSLITGHVTSAEVLIRWNHPLDGLVFPEQFIDIAESHGLIGELTPKVIGAALADLKAWQQDLNRSLQISINVSTHDLESLDFVSNLDWEVAAAGVRPEDVTIEVKERRLMQDSRALEALTRLRIKHYKISIDDFGTGNTSLSQLRDMPYDELKIDRAFVHRAWEDTTISAIFNTCISLGKQLDIKVVTQGIEDRADWDFVRKSGCDAAQGYFIAKPMPAESLHAWIEEWDERALPFSKTMDIARED